jgi:hypothetical protein
LLPETTLGQGGDATGMPSAVLFALAVALATSPSVPLFLDVDPVLVGIITVLLLIVFVFFLLIRRTLLSFSEGMREGRQ